MDKAPARQGPDPSATQPLVTFELSSCVRKANMCFYDLLQFPFGTGEFNRANRDTLNLSETIQITRRASTIAILVVSANFENRNPNGTPSSVRFSSQPPYRLADQPRGCFIEPAGQAHGAVFCPPCAAPRRGNSPAGLSAPDGSARCAADSAPEAARWWTSGAAGDSSHSIQT